MCASVALLRENFVGTIPPKFSWVMAQSDAWWQEPATLWLALGIALILAEMVIPQLFVVFLGLGALASSGAIYMGWVSSATGAVAVWIAASAAMLWGLRDILMRLAPGERSVENIDEDFVAAGTQVSVIAVDKQDPHKGRIEFRGSQWDAWSPDQALEVGLQVQLVARENLRWLVEPAMALKASPPQDDPSSSHPTPPPS